MQLAPWNTVRVTSAALKCEQCGATLTATPSVSVRAFMRELRSFERTHNACAPAARTVSAEAVAAAVISKAKR